MAYGDTLGVNHNHNLARKVYEGLPIDKARVFAAG